jgi:hypothetical protein
VSLAAVVSLAFAIGKGWEWGLLWWGVLNGALPVVALNVAFARRGRGTEAAAMRLLWIDLGSTAYIVLCGIAGAVLITGKRRSMHA